MRVGQPGVKTVAWQTQEIPMQVHAVYGYSCAKKLAINSDKCRRWAVACAPRREISATDLFRLL